MPIILTPEQVTQYVNRINSVPFEDKVAQAIQIYDELAHLGYNYAGGAAGVAREDSMTGLAAGPLCGNRIHGESLRSCRF